MTDQNYTFGTGPELPRGHDDRVDYRLTARAIARIQVEASEPVGMETPELLPPRILECRIRDISVGGFSLLSREAFAAQSILTARVDLANGNPPCLLAIETMWCRPAERGYLVGARVLESDETDYPQWMRAVADALAGG